MRLLTWNVQWCRGIDGRVDPERIASEIRRMDADVVCLQEVAAGFAEMTGRGENQAAALRHALPGYECVTAWAVDLPAAGGGRDRLGNVLLSRLPLGTVLRHSLPWPASPEAATMPRVALEAVVEAAFGRVRVVTTHLEYRSAAHRSAQVARLGEIHREALAPRPAGSGPYRIYPRPASAVLCGDCNFPPEDALYAEVAALGFADAWRTLHPGRPHPPTFRLHERKEGVAPYCCDYVFLTEDLAARLVSIDIDLDNLASDHQPVIVELRGPRGVT